MNRFMTLILVVLLTAACNMSDFLGPQQSRSQQPSGGVTVVPVATFAAPNATAGGEVSFLVQRAQEMPVDAGPNMKRIQLDTVISNLGETPLFIEAESFQMTDAEGETYQPVEPEMRQPPQLIGAEIPARSTLVGLLRFDVPADSVLSNLTLLWCIEPGCLAPLSAPVALPSE